VGGLLLAAVVPTNEPGTAMTTAAYLHRYASVIAFLALPVGGWLLARRDQLTPAARWLRGLAVASLVLAAAMVWSAYPGDRVLLGLAERLLILTEVGVLTVVALVLARSGSSTRVVAV
jgi:heme A synthase